MLSPHLSKTWLALTSTLLIAACNVEPGSTDSDTNTTETSAATETGSEASTETGSEDECAFDESDPMAGAQAQALVLINSGSTPLFVMPPACGYEGVAVDGEYRSLGTRFPCSNVVINPPCYDGCDGDFLTPPIRECPEGASACLLNGNTYQGEDESATTAVAISFTHGSPDPVMFDLAG